jgi:hypothetical protein
MCNVNVAETGAVNVVNVHGVLGHISMTMTQPIAKHLGWTESGNSTMCKGRCNIKGWATEYVQAKRERLEISNKVM